MLKRKELKRAKGKVTPTSIIVFCWLKERSWLKALKFYAFILWPYRPSSFMSFLTDSWYVLFTQGLSHSPFLSAHTINKTQLPLCPRVCCRVPHTGSHTTTACPKILSPSWDWQKSQTASCNFSFLTQHSPASPRSPSPALCRSNWEVTDICRARWKQPHQSSSSHLSHWHVMHLLVSLCWDTTSTVNDSCCYNWNYYFSLMEDDKLIKNSYVL